MQSGALIIDKPEGWTSHDVVGRTRRLAGTRRVGHTGTLDPFATGVLVVCVGPATRLAHFLADSEKEYLATVRLGWATDTQDLTGERVGERAAADRIPDDAALIRRVLAEMSGEQEQLPPMFSAKKVGGKALYKLARQGKEVERKRVRIRAEMELAGAAEAVDEPIGDDARALTRNADGTVDFAMRVRCSAGTYVRTLAHDVGARLGCGAHLAALRRTRAGRFSIDEAATLDEVEGRVPELLVPPERLVAHLPSLRVTDDERARVMHGGAITLDARAIVAPGEPCAILDSLGKLLAVGRGDDETVDLVRPKVVFNGDEAAQRDEGETIHR